jgi:hypothetical protein
MHKLIAVKTLKPMKKQALILAACLMFSAAIASAQLVYEATLNGFSESPANASPGTGFATVTYDGTLHTLALNISFSGLLGTTTASHIHAPTVTSGSGTAGVATTTPTFSGFPLGVTSGTYINTLDLTLSSSWNAAYITANGGTPAGAELAFATALATDKAYLNVHTSSFPGGEIRGFLVLVPEPSALSLLAIALLAVPAARRGFPAVLR